MKKQFLAVTGISFLALVLVGCLMNPAREFETIQSATAIVANDIHAALEEITGVEAHIKDAADSANLKRAEERLKEAEENIGRIPAAATAAIGDYAALNTKYKAAIHDPFYVFGKILRASIVLMIVAAVVLCVVFPTATPLLLNVSKFGVDKITAQLHALLPLQNIATADIENLVAWLKSKFSRTPVKSPVSASKLAPPPAQPVPNQI